MKKLGLIFLTGLVCCFAGCKWSNTNPDPSDDVEPVTTNTNNLENQVPHWVDNTDETTSTTP